MAASAILAKLAPALLGAGQQILSSVFPDPTQKAEAELELIKATNALAEGQLSINRIEARHPTIWVAGWRPFIGWTCGAAIAYSYILRDFLIIALKVANLEVPDLPLIDLADLWPVLLGLLGLGAMRTHEKKQGVAR